MNIILKCKIPNLRQKLDSLSFSLLKVRVITDCIEDFSLTDHSNDLYIFVIKVPKELEKFEFKVFCGKEPAIFYKSTNYPFNGLNNVFTVNYIRGYYFEKLKSCIKPRYSHQCYMCSCIHDECHKINKHYLCKLCCLKIKELALK